MTTATAFTATSVKALHEQAHAAGMAALEACKPTPTLWGSPPKDNPFSSEVDLSQPHSVDFEGPCGFASIRFKGNTAFGRAMRAAGLAKTSATGGLYIWVREGGQSLERKEAYAHAYSAVVNAAGASTWVESRMD